MGTGSRKMARHFPVSRPAISRHLRLPKDAGLIFDHSSGTRRVYQINARRLRAIAGGGWGLLLQHYSVAAEKG